MSVWREGPDGRWLPAEPLPEPFGIVWARAFRFRRGLGQCWVRAWVAGWRDARAVSRLAGGS